MFSLPRGVDTAEQILSEGKTDDNAIQLPFTLDQIDFDNLLTYLYMGPRCANVCYWMQIDLLPQCAS